MDTLKVFTYTYPTSKRVEKVLVNTNSIASISENNGYTLINFVGSIDKWVKVDGTIEDVYFKLTGKRM
jgi:hypothetical protein